MSAMRLRLSHLAALLLCGGLFLGFVAAQEGDAQKKEKAPEPKLFKLPDVLEKHRPPESVEELRQIEEHVQKVVAKVSPAVVGLLVGPGQGSGVIVKADGTILTAGHVSGKPLEKARVILRNDLTKTKSGKTYGQFKSIDSGMVKLTEGENYPHVEMGKSSELKVGQWVIAIGHPGGVRSNRGTVVRVGRILFVNQLVIRTDCTLVGGDSGGPLFDMQGRVIGIHSRIGGLAISENMHVPIDTYHETWAKLAAGDSWGPDLGRFPTVVSLGGKKILDVKDKLSKDDATIPCPEDDKKKSFHKVYNVNLKTGRAYTIDLVSNDKSGKQLDTFLRLESSEGKDLAHDDDGGGFPHSRLVYRPTKDADYKIVATSFSANQTGGFTLTVREAEFLPGPVQVFKAVKMPVPALEKVLQVVGKTKGAALNVNAMLVDDKGAPLQRKEVTLSWEQGKQTLKSDSEGFIRWELKKDQIKKLSLDLPKGVRAALVLTNQFGDNLPFPEGKDDKSIETVKSAGGKIVKTFDGVIAKTDPFDLEREKCYRHHHEFKMEAGKTYTLDLASEEFDAYLRIENEDKGKLAEDDDAGGFLNSRIVFTPESSGTFRLVVTTCDPGQLGTYRLTIRETDAKKATPKKTDKN